MYHAIEIINRKARLGFAKHVLFDFDGTLSLIRAGWQDVMILMMVDILQDTPMGRNEPREALKQLVMDYVTRLTGKQTIYQMIQLAEEVKKRNGSPLPPVEYKHRYYAHLHELIKGRIRALKEKEVSPDLLMVSGARELLQALRERGIACYLASGTDENFVKDEARSLHISQYFTEIYGALDDWKSFSKRKVIRRIVQEKHLRGEEFCSFGDGFVEMEETKAVGGIAVGVSSNEIDCQDIDERKRKRLIEAGADIIIPNFREYTRILHLLTEGTIKHQGGISGLSPV